MPRRYYLVLSLIVLVAAFLRVWQLASVPAGLHYDLAATALLGSEVAFHGYRPIFISAYTGHEALFYYWLALWFRLAGASVFTLRLAAATLGVLAVPAAFFALRETMRFEREIALTLAGLGAAFLATAFFHVTFSRFGFRVITEPVVQALALGFLFRGLWGGGPQWRTGSVPAFLRSPGLHLALAGAFTGLAAYTYLAARFFPLPLIVFWLAYLLGAMRRGAAGTLARKAYGQFLTFTAAALAVFAPLGVYFIQHPEDFLNRAGQVAPRAGETALLLDGLRRAAEMVFISGEPYDRYNLPGLPLFGPALGFFFVIGLLITLRNVIWPARFKLAGVRQLLPGATEWLLVAWLPAMLLPTALAVHDIYPSNLRAFGLIPLLFVFPARGLLAAYRWVQRWWPGPLIPYAYPMLVVTVAALAFGGYTTGRQYFDEWARLPAQPQNNDADLTRIAAYLNTQDLHDTSVYVSAIHYRHPTLAFLARDYDSIHWLTGGTALAVPIGRPVLYLFARSAPPPPEWIAKWMPYQVAAPQDPDGTPSYRAYRFEAGQTPPLPQLAPLEENFGNVARLSGYRVITGTEQILVDLRWQIDNLPDAGDYLPYARLTDAWGSGWSQSGGFSYPSEQWQVGDTVLTRLTLPLPVGLPPGEYGITAGLYSAGTQTNLPHLGANGAFAGERATVAKVTLAGGPAATLKIFQEANGLQADFRGNPLGPCLLLGNNAALLDATLQQSVVRQGEWLHLTLFWSAPFTPRENTLEILLGEQTLYSGQPVHGTYPFETWPADQMLIDRYSLKLPADTPPGDTTLEVSLASQDCGPIDMNVSVQAVERAFTPPAVDYAVRNPSSLGGVARLVGHSLSPGQPVGLRLVWQALAPMAADYTVFVHVLDSSGQIAAQADAQPRGGTYPTSMWEPGEYVVDDYSFDLPPGTYGVQVGFYLPETGERLGVDGAGEAQGVILLPEVRVP